MNETVKIKDFNVICRICLSYENNLISVLKPEISEMFKVCAPIQELHGNRLESKFPQHICENCHWDLKNVYNFKQKCNQSFEILCNLLIKEENESNQTDLLLKSETKDKLIVTENNDKSENGISSDSVKDEYNDIKSSLDNVEFDDADPCNNDDYDEDLEADKEDDPDFNLIGNKKNKSKNQNKTEKKSIQKKQRTASHYLMSKNSYDGLTCNICNKNMSSRWSMLRHMEVHDQNRALKFHCKTCGKGFYAAENLKKHELRHQGKTRFQCDRCPKRFYVLSALGVHCKSTHKAKQIQCSKCPQQFYHPLQVEQHLQTHKEKKFVCEDCGKIFPTKCRLNKHKKVHSSERPFKCSICSRDFVLQSDLTTHMKYRHIEADRREVCNVCGKQVHPSSLYGHLETHNEYNIKCTECDRLFKSKFTLNAHLKYVHKQGLTTDKLFYCEVCNKGLLTQGYLNAHMKREHLSSKSHKCHICGKIYKRLNSVRVHIRFAHLDVRPHACTECNKQFHTKERLGNHMRTHTGERPFSCTVCGKTFGFKNVLRTHMKVHSKG